LHQYGYEIRREGFQLKGLSSFLKLLKKADFKPSNVFDIGVGQSNWPLYEEFLYAHHILILATSRIWAYITNSL